MKQYIVEFLGTLVIVVCLLVTNANPFIMAIVYYAVYTIGEDVTTGHFNPLGALIFYAAGRVPLHETGMNIIIQMIALCAAVIAVIPISDTIQRL